MAKRAGLMEQDLEKLDVTKLNPLSPEVISRQATINIGILRTFPIWFIVEMTSCGPRWVENLRTGRFFAGRDIIILGYPFMQWLLIGMSSVKSIFFGLGKYR